MHHNQTKEGLERHIRILTEFKKLKETGFSGSKLAAARQISKILDIGETRVGGTIYNHGGKLERFIKELKELDGEVDVEVGDKDEVKEVQQVGSSEDGQVELWKSLLGIIALEGYSMEEEWYDSVSGRLNLSGPEELHEMLDILFEKDFLRKFSVSGEDGGEEGAFYLVSGDGKLVAKGEKEIELEGVNEEDASSIQAVKESETGENNNMHRLLKYIEGPGALRLMDRSFEILERTLEISESERVDLLRQAERSGLLENNGRAALAITSTGRDYLKSIKMGKSVGSDDSENRPGGRLLAAE